jgi:hypothetical protein
MSAISSNGSEDVTSDNSVCVCACVRVCACARACVTE